MKQQRVKSTAEIYNIPQAMIVPNPNQPRKRFDYELHKDHKREYRKRAYLLRHVRQAERCEKRMDDRAL